LIYGTTTASTELIGWNTSLGLFVVFFCSAMLWHGIRSTGIHRAPKIIWAARKQWKIIPLKWQTVHPFRKISGNCKRHDMSFRKNSTRSHFWSWWPLDCCCMVPAMKSSQTIYNRNSLQILALQLHI
jgi:hypothetical protein